MAETLSFDQFDPPTIRVDLAVSRMQLFAEDKMVQVWGHIGDYEVAVYLPLDDARVRDLTALEPTSHHRRGRKR